MGGEWTYEKIEDVAEKIGMGPFGSSIKVETFVPNGVPIISGQHLHGIRLEEQVGFNFITHEHAEGLKNSIVFRGDIIFTHAGNIKSVAYIPENSNYERYIVSQRQFYMRCNLHRVLPSFVTYYFKTPEGLHRLLANSSSVGVPSIAQPVSYLRQLRIPVPPLPEQRAIAAILGALDDKIELNRRMNHTLEAMARALFKHWFVDGAEEGWEVSSLGKLFPGDRDCVLTGPFGSHLHAHDYRDEGVPLLLVRHVGYGYIVEDNLPLVGFHKTPELDRYRLKIGDIVFTRVGAVGRTAFIHSRYENWLFSGQMLRVRVKDKNVLHPRYLAQVFLESSFIAMVESHALGTTRPSLNTELLQNFQFLVPPLKLQELFAEITASFDKKIQNNISQSRTLAKLRDTLLPKLLSGETQIIGKTC